MKFKANSIRTLDRFLKCCGGQENITLGIKLDDLGPEKLVEIGFGISPEEGLSIIPSVIGKFTSFNANGKEILRPDLPKEQYSVSYTSTTYDWHRNPPLWDAHTNSYADSKRTYSSSCYNDLCC
ncbi:Uncharacterised protein [Raoultella planticola]|uniref:Uncharacterized protein n=1 Tax=Raoultella planticola TaxID=575 RepID=A0A485B7Z0_RAOPL|nr:Uncharacterised protein [Raoultella planticola]